MAVEATGRDHRRIDHPPNEWRGDRWHGHHRHLLPRRNPDGRLLGGIATGLSRRMGLDVTIIRTGLVVGAIASGLVVAAVYVVAWLVVPIDGEDGTLLSRARHDWGGIALVLGLLPALAVALLIASAVGLRWIDGPSWAIFVAAAGLVLVWRSERPEQRDRLRRILQPLARLGLTGETSWTAFAVRLVAGIVLAVAGVLILAAGHPNGAGLRLLGGVLLVVAAAALVFGPWWLHIARDLVDERQARALAEERSEIASRIHDSVLQTLALIQRRADDPQSVVTLARAQERELRSWLFGGRVPGSGSQEDTTIAEAVLRIEREVEELHGVPINAVTVGDCPLDDSLRALVEAGQEATVNAAKWSGAATISLFVEVEEYAVQMWVRDRGIGFDTAAVGADRRGLSDSIDGRMTRHGGTARIRSVIGEGTEVALTMPREDAHRKKVGHR